MSGIPSWAVRGAKVVCVDGSPRPSGARYVVLPKEGDTYTIGGVEWFEWSSTAGWGLHLIGLKRFVNGRHIPFKWDRFRPLVSTKTEAEDAAMFRDLIRQPEAA